jgi:hypothetical protein
MGFEPPKAITLHLIVFKMIESIIRQGFYTYSASPKYLLFSVNPSLTYISLVFDFFSKPYLLQALFTSSLINWKNGEKSGLFYEGRRNR